AWSVRSGPRGAIRSSRLRGWRFVNRQPVMADGTDDFFELRGVGGLDDVAIDTQFVAFDDLNCHFGGSERDNRYALGVFVRFQLAKDVEAAHFVQAQIQKDEPRQIGWLNVWKLAGG